MPRVMGGWVRILGWLALAGYVLLLARHTAPVAGGSDSSGYLNSARLLADGRLFEELRAPAEIAPLNAPEAMRFIPQGFFPDETGARLTPTYPTGLPLHLALATTLLGWRAGTWAVLLLAPAAALWLCYRVARMSGVSRPLAAAGAVMLAALPVFIFTSIQPLSDTLATAWSLAALACGFRAKASRGWALACGAALGMAVLVRPTNLLFAPALVVLIGADPRRLACFVAGGAPAAAWMAFYNHTLYGGALRSGYGAVHETFAWAYGLPTAAHFLKWLALLLPAAVLVLPLAALLRREDRTRERWALLLAAAGVTILYLFYEVSREVWWCLRFILPAVPPLIILALLGAESLAQGRARVRHGSALVLLLWSAGVAWFWPARLGVQHLKDYELAYAEGAQAAQAAFPRGALVVSFAFSGSVYFYSDHAVLRWDQIEPPTFADYAARLRATGRPVCALLFESETAEAFRRCPGEWTRVASVRNVGLWRLTDPKS